MDVRAERGVVRHVALAYTADLTVLLTGVLVAGRLLLPWPRITTQIVPYDVADAIDRFTPFGLWQVYKDIVTDSFWQLNHTAAAPLSALLVALRILGTVFQAIPEALSTLYWQSSGLDLWACFAAIVMTLGTFVLSLAGGRRSPVRLLFAAVASPALTSMVFWLVQQTLIDAINTATWFGQMAPWCLPCPVICTLWWVVFPRAPHGAAATLLLFLQRCWLAFVRWRRPIKPQLAGSRPH